MVGPVDSGSKPMKAETGKCNDHCNTNSCSIDSGVGAHCYLVGMVHGVEWHLGMVAGRPSPARSDLGRESDSIGFLFSEILTLRLEPPEPTL